MLKGTRFMILALLVSLVASCGGDGIIASGGDFVLTVDQLRFEITKLGPSSGYRETYEGRLGVVERLAARSFLADEAEKRGYGGEELAKEVEMARDQAVAELYRQWKIDRAVLLPRIKTKPWIGKLDRKLHLKELVFAVYPIAQEALEDFRQVQDFDSLTEAMEGREDVRANDLGWVIWKDLGRGVANVVFRLDVGEISDLLPGSDGYHLFYLAEAQPFGLTSELLSLRSKRFVQAMEKERLEAGEKQELSHKYKVAFHQEGLRAGLQVFGASFRGERPQDTLMDEVVATYAGGKVIVADLYNLYYAGPAESRPYVGDYHGLQEFAVQIMLPHLEAMAGYDLGMGRSMEVMWAGRKAREEYLVPMMEDDFRSQIEVTDQDIADYYANRKDDLVTPARFRARRIVVESAEDVRAVRSQLAAGKPFEQVAQELSQDPQTAGRGGDLGWVTCGMIAIYDSVLTKLRPREVSQPFETTSGIEILKLEDREEPRQLTFEEAIPRIKVYITNTRANQLLAEWVERKKAELGFSIDEKLLRSIRLPKPGYMQGANRQPDEDEEEEIPVLPKMD